MGDIPKTPPVPNAESLKIVELIKEMHPAGKINSSSQCYETEPEDETLRALCHAVREATLASLERPMGLEEVKQFLSEEAPKIVLPPGIQKKLDNSPDQLPGSAERMALFYSTERGASASSVQRLLVRSETTFRARSCDRVTCWGRDREITQAYDFLTQDGWRTMILSGAPGIGKTTLAKAVSNQLVTQSHDMPGLSPSNVHFFDCVGLSTPGELTALLMAQLLDTRRGNVPADQADCISLIKRQLSFSFGTKQPLLWTFDGLDAYFQTSSKAAHFSFLISLLTSCAEVANQLKLIITVAQVAHEPALKALLRDSVRVESVQLLPRGGERETSDRGDQDPQRSQNRTHHPLAFFLVDAAARWLGRRPPRQMPLFPEDNSTILNDACESVWAEFSEREHDILRCFSELPGGVWCMEDGVPSPMLKDVEWSKVFKDEHWASVVQKLCNVGWLTLSVDESDRRGVSRRYRLRPALRRFVTRHTTPQKLARIRERMVYYWARRLKCWSGIIAGRFTERVEPRLPRQPRRQPVLAEEHARYLLDLNRLNWLHAFRMIRKVAQGNRLRDSIALHAMFLRGSISYCRIAGLQSLFMGMADCAIAESERSCVARHSPTTWREIVNVVCLAICYGIKGRTHRRLGEWQRAEQSLRTAEEKLLTLAVSTPYVQRQLAWILTELGRVYHAIGLLPVAERRLHDAVDIRRQLVSDFESSDLSEALSGCMESDGFECTARKEQRYLASALNFYGNVLAARYEWKVAEAAQREALEIREQLVGQCPLYFQRYLSNCLNDLGNVLFYQGKLYEAVAYYKRALTIRKDLVPHAESALGQYVARTCNNLGNTYRKLGLWEDAERMLEQAVRIYRAGSMEYATKFNDLLARTLSNLGRVYYHQGRIREAVETFEQSDRLHTLAHETFAQMAPFDWIENSNFLALAYLESNLVHYAVYALQKTDKLLDKGEKICSRNANLLRAYTWNTRAKILLRNSSPSDWVLAELLLLQSEQLRLRLKSELGTSEMLNLHFAQNWHDLGCVLRKLNRCEEAASYFRDALELRRQLMKANEGYVARLVARTAMELAGVYVEVGLLDEALDLYVEAEERFDRLAQMFPGAFLKELERARHACREHACGSVGAV